MLRSARLTAALCASALALLPSLGLAEGSLRGEYFVLPGTHPDVNHGADGSIVRGLLEKRLGPDRLPIVTKFGRSYSGSSGKISDVNALGELMWYSAADTRGGRREKIVTSDRLPFKFDAFYPDGKHGDGDAKGYRVVHWSGTFTLSKTQSVGLSLGSDDDSWVFIDRTLVVDNGGVKPLADAPFTSARLQAGSHDLDIFYADRHGASAELHLSTAFPVAPPSAPAAIAKVPPAPKAANLASQIKKTGRVAVYGIHFAFDRADITKDSDAILNEVANVLRSDASLRLRIEGHTDDSGDDAYNRALSQRRADAVKAYLVHVSGIAPNRLTTQGFGPDRPIASNANSEGRYKNRRVELVRL
jgi:fibro-slime domain-containing protein